MDVATLLEDPPRLHRDKAGTPIFFGKISDQVARVLDRHVTKRSRTLETGAGISTVIFAIKGAKHTCVVPLPDLVGRIKEWCKANGISTKNVEFVVERSEIALPNLRLKDLDLVLVDGAHAFPMPCIDWFYTAPALKPGGLMIIDDTQLISGQLMKDFLLTEVEWDLAYDFAPRACAFVKTGLKFASDWWHAQLYLTHDGNKEIIHPLRQALVDIAGIAPSGTSSILVADNELLPAGYNTLSDRKFVRLTAVPVADSDGVDEVERLRKAGAAFIFFPSQSFWWLKQFKGLEKHLRARYKEAIANERVIGFDLRKAKRAPATSTTKASAARASKAKAPARARSNAKASAGAPAKRARTRRA
jgi:Methyltransferase domain